MKKALFILSTLLFQINSFAQYTAIPDVNFEQKLISLGYDSGAIDHKVLTSNINTITQLEIYNTSISDFTGIQDFVALLRLTLDNNKVSNINFGILPNLIYLGCSDNKQLTSIDISGLSALEGLTCTNNNLTNLNLSGLKVLKDVYCNGNSFPNIKLSGLPSLEIFYCLNNKIKLNSIELIDLPVFRGLECMNSQITNISFSGVPALSSLNCNNNSLTSLNLSAMPPLKFLYCSKNNLTSLNISGLATLSHLDCSSNQFTSINLSGLTSLQILDCRENQFTSLDVSGLTTLSYLFCFNNPLLTCIQVDDTVAAMANSNWLKDGSASYSLNCALATSSHELTNPVTVFPNPTKDILTLQFSGATIINKIFITDLTGKTVLQQMLTSNQVNVQNLAKGMYILQAYSGKEKYTTKFAKE